MCFRANSCPISCKASEHPMNSVSHNDATVKKQDRINVCATDRIQLMKICIFSGELCKIEHQQFCFPQLFHSDCLQLSFAVIQHVSTNHFICTLNFQHHLQETWWSLKHCVLSNFNTCLPLSSHQNSTNKSVFPHLKTCSCCACSCHECAQCKLR